MLEEIGQTIHQETNIDLAIVQKVLTAFTRLLLHRSLFIVWQRAILKGRTHDLVILASTTNVGVTNESFPVEQRLIQVEGVVRGTWSEADYPTALTSNQSPRLLEKK